MMLALLMILTLGLLSLSSIELRRSARQEHAAAARANARMALMAAIGQLQKTMGPDQRVSATAEILGNGVKQPHWTGAWRTGQADGSSWFERNDLDGGLRDGRSGRTGKEEALAWLVSGNGDPRAELSTTSVSVRNGPAGDAVKVPLIEIGDSGKVEGRYGWWTGDLGVRANIATADPRAGIPANRESPSDGGMYRMLAGAAPDIEMMTGAAALGEGEGRLLLSPGTTGLTKAGLAWSRRNSFDFTVASSGVLADVMQGGLKKDLTVYLSGDGSVPSPEGLPGLTDDDIIVGALAEGHDREESRHLHAGPRFGLLRSWANKAVPFNCGSAGVHLPEIAGGFESASRSMALANEQPVKLGGNLTSGLQPILVEATNYTQISAFQLDPSPQKRAEYQIRHHHYPRVVLWNPYNVELETERAIIMMQGNGRQEMWTQNAQKIGNSTFNTVSQWLSFEGGRSTEFNAEGKNLFSTDGYNDPYIGSYYFSIPATKFGPGDCLVFSPARSAEYDGLSPYRPGSYNLNSNELSCEVVPDPSRSYYISGTEISGGIPYQPTAFWFAPTPYWSEAGRNGVENQSDDTRAIFKHVGDRTTVTFEAFDALPQLSVLSASLQFGAGKEPRISWSSFERMPIELLDRASPQPTVIPNVRTREGIRLRWFDEHPSNKLGSGALANTPHFDEALLANWNPRASFSIRSPWDNVAGSVASDGSSGGPWFFGAYTRDLFDQAVSWDEQVPVPRDGRYHGNPFGPPQEGTGRYVLFDVPRRETGVVSLAQFQHAKLSELIWHPSYAIGNSLADPRLGEGGHAGLNRTAAVSGDSSSAAFGGFHEDELGWSDDRQRAATRDEWAVTARAILGDAPASDNLVYDLSFEANHTLWDRFFLSGGNKEEKRRFLSDPLSHPLPNGRLRPVRGTPSSSDALDDYHRAAAHLMVDGAFNVNSTRVEAWKALLGSPKLTGYGNGGTPFPRVLDPPGGAWKNGDTTWDESTWDGYRELDDGEIHRLAEAIVDQIKLRGPFISLADFVNRRLAEDETGRMGALQAAIEAAGLNASHQAAHPLDNTGSLPDYSHPDHLRDATRMEQMLKPASKMWGAPSYLTQADILQAIGPALTARSDTFVVRAYGDSVDADGHVQARAWCEATVQRMPEPLIPDASGINPRDAGKPGDFGRRFLLTSFRWLSPAEI